MKHKITPEIRAHINALIAWNGKTNEEAEAYVDELYEKLNNDSTAVCLELDKSTYANSSIITAMNGIEKYYDELKKNPYDTVIKILSEIHDQWVIDNDKKYNRDANEQDKNRIDRRLYQHLPIELIGIKEATSDLLFLAPFLEEMGINVGRMEQSYIPSSEVVEAYNGAVKKWQNENGIKTAEDLKSNMGKIIDSYSPLKEKGKNGLGEERLDYMKARCDLLAEQVGKIQEKNFPKARTFD